jgi:hypothetical protein
MTGHPPAAAIRTQVTVPLRFPDGYQTTARVTTFSGLVDGRENLPIGLGTYEANIALGHAPDERDCRGHDGLDRAGPPGWADPTTGAWMNPVSNGPG